MARARAYHLLSSAAAPPRGAFIALAPGEQVTGLSVEMPPRVPAQARPAIARRQLEDRFALEQTEFFALTGPPPWTQVLAVQAEIAAGWRSTLAPFGARCIGVIPDYLALPVSPGGAGTLWVLPAHAAGAEPDAPPDILARFSATRGFRAEWDVALAALSLTVDLPAELQIHGPLSPEQRAALEALPCTLTHVTQEVPDLSALRPARSPLPVNLLEDAAAQTRQMARSLRRWLVPVMLAGTAAAAWAFALWSDVQRGADHLAQLRAVNTQTVRQYFIPNGPLLDLRAQVQQVITASGGSTGDSGTANAQTNNPMPLLQTLSAGLSAAQAEVGQILYSAPVEPGQPLSLSVQLGLPGFAELDALLEALRGRAMAVTVTQSAADPAGGVQARLQIRAAAAQGGGQP